MGSRWEKHGRRGGGVGVGRSGEGRSGGGGNGREKMGGGGGAGVGRSGQEWEERGGGGNGRGGGGNGSIFRTTRVITRSLSRGVTSRSMSTHHGTETSCKKKTVSHKISNSTTNTIVLETKVLTKPRANFISPT
ncbi:hypothetical protein H6P81_006101 [Aristolochia fimbriata]|uniref:Uncharacterized protein n=1 Tax=Aristolochia fimbriata TaxID=158543 RepID=A0AAV7F0A3_ARIFI|nr:hypothetical protein H6P81_006101 [Aristolochia fimbriata]